MLSVGAGVTINLLDTPYFLATKLAALRNRGLGDLRMSSDFEDIVYIVGTGGRCSMRRRLLTGGLGST